MDNNSVRYYEFGEFRLDTRRRILFKNGEPTPLSTRICYLLLVMLQNEGKILEHDELLDKVWEGMFVEQANLKKCVSTLRHILGEQPNESIYIKTIPRRGYSFIAAVRAIADDNPSGAFYLQQTDTEIIVEEEIIEDDEPTTKFLTGKPQTFFNRIGFSQILLLIGVIFVLGAVILGVRFFLKKNSTSFSADNIRITKLTSDGKVYAGGVSADGNYLVYYTTDKEGLASLWIKQIAAESATRIVQPIKGAFYSFIFTPDGNYVYYTINNFEDPKQSGIYKVPALGGTPAKIMDKGVVGAFTLDGKKMILGREIEDKQNAIIIADLDGNNERQLAVFNSEHRLWGLYPSPDKTNLLIVLRRQYQNKVTFRVSEIPLDSTPQNLVLHDIIPEQERAIRGAVWLPDKSSLLLGVRETNAEIVQLWQYYPSSNEWRRVTNDNNFYAGINLIKGGNAFVSSQSISLTGIWLTENDLTESKQVGNSSSNYIQAEWMSDGRILFDSIENQQEMLSIMSLDGSSIQRISSGNDGIRLKPNLPANEKFISFVSSRSGTMQIWRMDLDGKNLTKMTDTAEQIYSGSVLSDGQTVVYIAFRPAGWIILKQTPDGKTIHLTESESDLLAISPDEKTFASYVKDDKTQKLALRIGSIEDGTIIKTFDAVPQTVTLKFTPDGTGIAFISAKNNVNNISIQPIDGSPLKQFTNFRSDIISFFDWSPDGKNLLLIRGKSLTDAVVIKSEIEKTSQ